MLDFLAAHPDALERYVSEENMKPIYARLNEKLRSVPGK